MIPAAIAQTPTSVIRIASVIPGRRNAQIPRGSWMRPRRKSSHQWGSALVGERADRQDGAADEKPRPIRTASVRSNSGHTAIADPRERFQRAEDDVDSAHTAVGRTRRGGREPAVDEQNPHDEGQARDRPNNAEDDGADGDRATTPPSRPAHHVCAICAVSSS